MRSPWVCLAHTHQTLYLSDKKETSLPSIRPSQSEKADAFSALHQAAGAFVIPNPWDLGTARLLEQSGFPALATTSAGFAFSHGQPDNTVSLEALLAHLAELTNGTSVPVSADLENGFGDEPQIVARTIRLAAEAGVAGGSIEDSTGRSSDPLYECAFAMERIRAAAEAAKALPFRFTLTARAENFLVGRPDLADTIARLQAYQEAGADVLYAPGLSRQEDIAQVIREVDRPLNVLIGFPSISLGVRELEAMGVKRISVGGSLARAALGELMRAAIELRDQGTTGYARTAMAGKTLNEMFTSADGSGRGVR